MRIEGCSQKLRPSTRPMQFVLTSRASWCSFLVPSLGAQEGLLAAEGFLALPPYALHLRLAILTPSGGIPCVESESLVPAVRRKCEIAYDSNGTQTKPAARFSSHARMPANTAAHTSKRSTCCSDYTARISRSFGCFAASGTRATPCQPCSKSIRKRPRSLTCCSRDGIMIKHER